MKSFVLSFLLAAAAAEEGVTCADMDDSWLGAFDPSNPNVHSEDIDGCKAACTDYIDSENDNSRSYCCNAATVSDGSLDECILNY